MSNFERARWAVSHDPCRAGDRTPSGPVGEGAIVHLTLRVDPYARDAVGAVSALVGERVGGSAAFIWTEVSLTACDEGYAGFFTLESQPHVAFYAFVFRADDGGVAYYVPRADGRSTTGELVIPGEDGEWTDHGWHYSVERLQKRPMGDFGLGAPLPGFQITVFDSAFTTPEWFTGAIMYQIFPDRFSRGASGVRADGLEYHLSMGRPVRLHESWDEPVYWKETPEELYDPVDFFGGTLEGITQKLPYLASLGVEALYLNPIFEARSNHRYDTADYRKVDPLLGTDEDFVRLTEEARKLGISVILDAVLSHTGRDSRYFNAAENYDWPGAAQGERSPYYSWYDFEHPNARAPYRCWWGDPSLPEVDERNPLWQQFMMGVDYAQGAPGDAAEIYGLSETGVLPHWIRAGVGGYRLDVADELPDDVLERIRACVKHEDPQAVIIGEVWEDATTKQSYGVPRTYALGRAVDSVMNYPLRSALLGFAAGALDAHHLAAFLKQQRDNYPHPLYGCLMNMLSTHDVERVRSALAAGEPLRHRNRDEQRDAVAALTAKQDAGAAVSQRLITSLLYALPGVPCLYYGDELGLHGGSDPFCRATFPDEEDANARKDVGVPLVEFHRQIGALRKGSATLREGSFACTAPNDDVLCIVRVSPAKDSAIIAVVNRADEAATVAFDASAPESGLSGSSRWAVRHIAGVPKVVFCNVPDCDEALPLDGERVAAIKPPRCEDGIFCAHAPAGSAVFWEASIAE